MAEQDFIAYPAVPTEAIDQNAFPPGMVGIISHDLARYTDFSISVVQLMNRFPPGSQTTWCKGVEIAIMLNNIVRATLALPEKEWLLILGDDHAFEPNIILKLLRRNVDIVVPLCSRRIPPLVPTMYMEDAVQKGRYRSLRWEEVQPYGLQEVDGAGSAGMMIKRHVLEKMADPWFEIGQGASDAMAEDLYFCKKAREAGFKILVDTEMPLGHITPMTIWPMKGERGHLPMIEVAMRTNQWAQLL